MEKSLARFPFLGDAKRYVEDSEFSLEDLTSRTAFSRARERAKRRVIGAIEDGRVPPPRMSLDREADRYVELFSYPLARVIVSCVNDSYLIKRYCLAEAKVFYDKLKNGGPALLEKVSEAIGLETCSREEGNGFTVHFTDFLRLSSSLREKRWKLVNQDLSDGLVRLDVEKFTRLLQEGIKREIEVGIPLSVPEEVCEDLSEEVKEVEMALEERKSTFRPEVKGEVKKEFFPPCIELLIKRIKSSQNLSHTARFAVVAFLVNIGMERDEIKSLFRVSPDFEDERTEYQINHIAGEISSNMYTPPSCSTMRTYGFCPDPGGRCRHVSHPLGYYRWSLKSEAE